MPSLSPLAIPSSPCSLRILAGHPLSPLPFKPHISYRDLKTPLQHFFLQEALPHPLRLSSVFPVLLPRPPAFNLSDTSSSLPPTIMVSSSRLKNMTHLCVSSGHSQGLGTWQTREKHVASGSGLGPKAETRAGGSNNMRQVDSPTNWGKMEERGGNAHTERGRRTKASQRDGVKRGPRQRPGRGFGDLRGYRPFPQRWKGPKRVLS